MVKEQLQQTSQKVVYGRIIEGIIHFYFPKGYWGAKKFEIDTDRDIVSIKGTKLIVKNISDVTTIEVLEGSVEVIHKATSEILNVSAGEMVAASENGVDFGSAEDTADSEEWRELISLSDSQISQADELKGSGDVPTNGEREIIKMNFGFKPGSIWKVKEYGPMGNWDGEWVIRKDARTIDASWSGGSITDIIDIKSIKGDQVTLYRNGNKGYYTGTISHDGLSMSGTASWYSPGEKWTASTTSPGSPPKPSISEGL